MNKILLGIDKFITNPPPWAKNKRIGLLCHQASLNSKLIHSKILLYKNFPAKLTCLFSPQHGLFAQKQDNMIESYDVIDDEIGIPVFSLYGKTRIPKEEHLSLIDIFVVDLQDVGTRVYTYIWTMLLAMKACAKKNITFVVLDRPNPISGEIIEGNILEKDLFSFVGLAPIPMRHGMTMGELALYFKEYENLDLDLHVIKMDGWKRKMFFDQTELYWVWPSPNMPTLDTAIVYPGQVIFEGTNISEGRGTTKPFEVFGAPFLEPKIFLEFFNKIDINWKELGFFLRRQDFEPTFNKWKNNYCYGFQIHVLDRLKFRPYLVSLAILYTIIKTSEKNFSWKSPPYEYEFKKLPIDLIIGNKEIRTLLKMNDSFNKIIRIIANDLKRFKEIRQKFLLYS